MHQDLPNQKPNILRHPIKWGRWWWSVKAPSNKDGALVGALTAYITLAGLAIVSVLAAALRSDVSLPGWLLALSLFVLLIAGVLTGAVLLRTFYEPRLSAAEARLEGAEAKVTAAEDRAVVELERRQMLEPDSEAMQRLGVYLDYIYLLFDDICKNIDEFASLTSDAVRRSICELPREAIRETAATDVAISVWVEGNSKQHQDDTPSIRITDPGRTFWIAAAPDHTHRECSDFQVPVRGSWIAHSQELQEADPDQQERVFKADPLSIAGIRGRDIDAFVKHDYESVRGAAFHFGQRQAYVIVLSTEGRVLSQVEDRFLVLLATALEVASELATAVGAIDDTWTTSS